MKARVPRISYSNLLTHKDRVGSLGTRRAISVSARAYHTAHETGALLLVPSKLSEPLRLCEPLSAFGGCEDRCGATDAAARDAPTTDCSHAIKGSHTESIGSTVCDDDCGGSVCFQHAWAARKRLSMGSQNCNRVLRQELSRIYSMFSQPA